MMRTLSGNGAVIGASSNSAVLEFQRLPNNLMDKLPMDVSTIELVKHGMRNENNFIVRWKNEESEICFLVTKGRATATGQPRVDIRPWHNSKLPPQDILECVVVSSLRAIKFTVEDRNWGDTQEGKLKPATLFVVPLEDRWGNQLVLGSANHFTNLNRPMPDAHIYVINDRQMMEAFIAVGALPRLFGEKPMIPGINVLKSESPRQMALSA